MKPRRSQTDPAYRQMIRVVEGAVKSAFDDHPEYAPAGVKPEKIRNSIAKRVVGALGGWAAEAHGRAGGLVPAVETAARSGPSRDVSSAAGCSRAAHGEVASSLASPVPACHRGGGA